MFSLVNVQYNQEGVSTTIDFQLPNGMARRTFTIEGAAAKVQRAYLDNAFDYIGFAFDQLLQEVQTIKPHFFNKTAKPYLQGHDFWIRAYWMLQDKEGVFREAQRTRNVVWLHRCVTEMELNFLDPCFELSNQAVIQELIKDIMLLSEECKNLFLKLTK